MTVKTPEEVHGREHDWLACDGAGRVALLTTAGGGHAPRAFLADTDLYDRAIETILRLPATSAVDRAPQLAEGLPNTWRQAAERGIYGFDSDYFGGAYRLVGVPRDPVLVEQLPSEVAVVVKRITLGTIRFDRVEEIAEADITRNEDTH